MKCSTQATNPDLGENNDTSDTNSQGQVSRVDKIFLQVMKDNLWWKTTFDESLPLMEDDLCWKTTFDGRLPFMEDNLGGKTTFDGRQPLMENDL